MAVYSAVLQLVAAVPAGRAMDRYGRRPVVGGGFLSATVGCGLTALATAIDSPPLLILGFALTGAASGIALLIRTAAGDMYPPEKRARGISYVLFGAVFGAILGPLFFGPLFAGRELDAAALTVPWLVAAGISLVPLVLIWFVRPDPKRIAELLAPRDVEARPAAP